MFNNLGDTFPFIASTAFLFKMIYGVVDFMVLTLKTGLKNLFANEASNHIFQYSKRVFRKKSFILDGHCARDNPSNPPPLN